MLVIAAFTVVMLAIAVAGMAATPTVSGGIGPGPTAQPVVASPAPAPSMPVAPSLPDVPLR